MLPEVGIPEMLVIAVIALIVVGPKDLPMLLRKVGGFLAHMRSMASEFRASFDELARQSELEELRKEVEAMRHAAHEPLGAAADALNASQVMSEIHDGLGEAPPPIDLAASAAAEAAHVPVPAEPEPEPEKPAPAPAAESRT